ncbi:pantoate--beta-alanine ligase [Thermodesulfobacteriota bacterium]
MKVIETAKDMQRVSEDLRLDGKILALVPTMGFFHEGHLEIMKDGEKRADTLIVSIFVNPMQFGPAEDFEEYPRSLESDLSKAQEAGVDLVFTPPVEDIYPEGFQTKICVEKMTRHLCGLSRPGHFDGVTTVVAKLFNITKPHIALFGEKDYQQLKVISRMARDLNMDIDIIGVPTVRESDGLAMSSRNSYLSAEERKSALSLKKSLDLAAKLVHAGERDADKIRTAVEKLILSHPHTAIDYINLCHPETIEEIETIEGEALIALAVLVGKTRLIDNGLLNG